MNLSVYLFNDWLIYFIYKAIDLFSLDSGVYIHTVAAVGYRRGQDGVDRGCGTRMDMTASSEIGWFVWPLTANVLNIYK